MVGAGINAVETKRIIASTEVVRVAFETGDRDLFFVDLAAETGATLDHVGSTVPDDGPPTMTFTVSGATPEAIEAFAADAPAIAAVNVIAETETDVLVEFDLASDSIVALLAEYGAKTRAITASGGTARIEVEVPQGDAARQLVDVVTDRYAETDMASYREDASTERTRPEFAAAVRDQLTDRQFTALQRAYAAEFFAWPRPVSGGELAESMDISRPTFHQHLRAAQRKLVTAFFEDNPDR
jgi:predicted DNA binding protein